MKIEKTQPIVPSPGLDGKKPGQAEKSGGGDFNRQLESVAEEMEALFLEQMLKEMRNNPTGEGGLFAETFESGFYRDMHDAAIAKDLAKSGGMGLGKFIYDQLKREEAPRPVGDSTFQKKI